MALNGFRSLSTQELWLLREVAVHLSDHRRIFMPHEVCRRDGVDPA